MDKSDAFDLLGVCTAGLFAFSVWPPAVLLVIAVASFAAGAKAHRSRGRG